jgi:hypothetical protein
MKLEKIDLHGLSLNEAIEKVLLNIDWCIKHQVDILDINHGKGLHSSRNFSVLKKEIRKILGDLPAIKQNDYRIVPGEADLPVALTFDEGHTLIVRRGLEKNYIGGRKQQEKNQQIYSQASKKQRKYQKMQNSQKKRNNRGNSFY